MRRLLLLLLLELQPCHLRARRPGQPGEQRRGRQERGVGTSTAEAKAPTRAVLSSESYSASAGLGFGLESSPTSVRGDLWARARAWARRTGYVGYRGP